MERNVIYQIIHIKVEKIWVLYDIYWDLVPAVNVLIGDNGAGKSTFINLVYGLLTFDLSVLAKYNYQKISILTNLGEFSHQKQSKYIELDKKNIDEIFYETNIALVNTFDKKIIQKKKKDSKIKSVYKKISSLDKDLELLMNIFIPFQMDIYKSENNDLYRQIRTLSEREKENRKNKLFYFFKILNEFIFKGKYEVSIDANYLISMLHIQNRQIIELSNLSSGEKQILIILLQALLTKNEPCIFLLDEPELSLHIAVQEKLIDYIRKLNENAQLIIVTHSPSIVSNGYMDSFFEIENLKTYENK